MTKTIFELTEGSAPLGTDYALTGEDPAGTHVLRRTTWASIKNLFTSLQAAAGSDVTAGTSTTLFATPKALKDAGVEPNLGGWILSGDTWTYASATTFTISGDKTGVLSIGDKLKLTQTTVKYFYVVGVSYSSPNTTVTVTGGSDYTLANATITSPHYSHSSSPVGFPQWFNYTPTGISATNVTLSGRFCINGRMVRASFRAVFSGAITFTSMPTLPVTASANYLTTGNSIISACGVGGYLDYGTAYFPGELTPTVIGSGTTLGIYKVANGTGQPGGSPITATSPITWANGDAIECQYTYEI